MDAVMMAYQIVDMHKDLEAYREEVKRLRDIEEKYTKLLVEFRAHAHAMQANVLRVLLQQTQRDEVYLIFKDDKGLEYAAPEVIFIYEDKDEVEAVVTAMNEEDSRLHGSEREDVEYYSISWEVQRKKEKKANE